MEEVLDLVRDGDIYPKQLGKLSIPFFVKWYFGYDVPVHQQNWYRLFRVKPYTLLLSPRDHGKTTTVSRFYVEWMSLYHPNHRTLLLSKSYKQSIKSMEVIIQDVLKNKRIKSDFSEELQSYHKKENMLRFNVTKAQRDATVEAQGLLGSVTGSHFDLIVNDDLVDDENTRTPKGMEDTHDWFRGTVSPLLEPGGSMITIGTRKHYNDLYSQLIANPLWYVHRDEAIATYPKYKYVRDEKGNITDVLIKGKSKVLWKQKWDIKKLLMKQAEIGSIFFNREYQNDPAGLQGKVLNRDWIQYYKYGDIYYVKGENKGQLKVPMTIYQAWDLAIADSSGSDYTVCVTAGVTPDHKIYVLDLYRQHLSFPKQIKNILRLQEEFKPVQIGIESNVFQKAVAQQLDSMAFLPIQEVVSTANKEMRIKASSVHYENRRVFFREDLRITDEFLKEFAQFPKGAHDDMLDAMDILFGLVRGTSVEVNPFLIVGAGKSL
jgi:predicted phage terminase large subunit-like protein